MIGWEQWRSLLAVAKFGSFAGAAKSQGVNATTISRRIQSLERQLGFKVFTRSGNTLLPTRRCEQVLGHIENADDALREAAQLSVADSRGTVWRELRMTAPPFLINNLFAPALTTLTAKRRLRVTLIATSSNEVLTRREADISVRIEDRPNEFKLDYDRIDAVRLPPLTYAVYAKSGIEAGTLPWAGLIEQHPWTTGTGMRITSRLCGPEGLRYTAQHFDALYEIVASGAARALLPDIVAGSKGGVARASSTSLSQPLWMLYHKQDADVPHLRATRDWIVKNCSAALRPEDRKEDTQEVSGRPL